MLKRIRPGYYQARINGCTVEVSRVAARGIDGGRVTGWNVYVNGKLQADWLVNLKSAYSAANRLCQ